MNRLIQRNKQIARILFIMVFIISVFVGAYQAWSSVKQESILKRQTTNYLEDVVTQVVARIDTRILQSKEKLILILDSAIRFPEQDIQSFLDRKKALTDFDCLYYEKNQDEAKKRIMELSDYEEDKIPIDFSRKEGSLIFLSQSNKILYCIPHENGSYLIATKSAEGIQQMLSEESFRNQAYSFTITDDGQIISKPGDTDTFARMASFQESDYADHEKLQEMEEQIEKGEDGIEELTLDEDRKIMVSYHHLEQADWVVLTVIPSDVISKEINSLSAMHILASVMVILFAIVIIAILYLAQRKYQEALEKIAFVDGITGGFTEPKFQLEAEKALKDPAKAFSFVSMDVKSFKAINNLYGVEEGDEALRFLYGGIASVLGETSLLCRASADLYYFLLEEQDTQEITAKLQKIISLTHRKPMEKGEDYKLDLRFGVYIIEDPSENILNITEKANATRTTERMEMSNIQFYDQEIQLNRMAEKQMIDELEKAIEHNEFQIFLHPKILLETSTVRGAEVLTCWNRRGKEFLRPSEFIPIFEKYGVLLTLDLYIFEQVCKLLSKWRAEGKKLLTISVNISKNYVLRPNIIEKYKEIRDRYHLPYWVLEFEITANGLFENTEKIRNVIDEMHKAGFLCALDNFGSGYASLNSLNVLDVDTIKLNRNFFSSRNNSKRGRTIVEAVVNLISQLRIETVAEGVDEIFQVNFLKSCGCTMVQGSVYASPLPVEEFEKFVENHQQVPFAEEMEEDADDADKNIREKWKNIVYSPEGGNQELSVGVIPFFYDLEKDRITFATIFSQILGQRHTIEHAQEFLRTSEFIYPDDRENFFALMEKCNADTSWIEDNLRFHVGAKGYEWLEVYMVKNYEQRKNGTYITGVLINSGFWRMEIKNWREKAQKDVLTGLYNREYFYKHAKSIIEKGNTKRAAIIFVDLDNFKAANDTMGHSFGDEILRNVAKRMTRVFRSSDIIARYGGDEFVIFMENVSKEVICARMEQLKNVFSYPYRSDDCHYQISASIGAARYPDDGEDLKTLIDHADVAVYAAKHGGKNQYILYDASLEQREIFSNSNQE